MSFFDANNETVNKMGHIQFTGNIIPPIWYKTLAENGKPKLLAISMLAEFVYWYRPAVVRNENTGAVLGWKKRFRGEMLQKGYNDLVEQFGADKKTIQRNLVFLENRGLIKRHFVDENGMGNIMYIELFAEQVYEVTYPGETVNQNNEIEEKCAVDNIDQSYGQNSPKIRSEMSIGIDTSGRTNTEITTKTTSKNMNNSRAQKNNCGKFGQYPQRDYDYDALSRRIFVN